MMTNDLAVREPPSLRLVCRQHLQMEVAEVRRSPFGRRVRLRRWVGVNLHYQTFMDLYSFEVKQDRGRADSGAWGG